MAKFVGPTLEAKALTLTTDLGVDEGGTGGHATPTANGVAYGTGSAAAYTAAGTTAQVLTATTGGAPTWQAAAGGGGADPTPIAFMLMGA